MGVGIESTDVTVDDSCSWCEYAGRKLFAEIFKRHLARHIRSVFLIPRSGSSRNPMLDNQRFKFRREIHSRIKNSHDRKLIYRDIWIQRHLRLRRNRIHRRCGVEACRSNMTDNSIPGNLFKFTKRNLRTDNRCSIRKFIWLRLDFTLILLNKRNKPLFRTDLNLRIGTLWEQLFHDFNIKWESSLTFKQFFYRGSLFSHSIRKLKIIYVLKFLVTALAITVSAYPLL